MGKAETFDGGIGIVIMARNTSGSIGTPLDHPHRVCGSRSNISTIKGEARASIREWRGADKRICNVSLSAHIVE